MDAGTRDQPPNRFWTLILSACAASVWIAAAGGCCGGRPVSIRLYDEPSSISCCSQCGGAGCGLCRKGHLAGWGLHGRHREPHGADGFQGPAFNAPLPRFHPVPTRPVFERRDDYVPLQTLPSGPPATGDSKDAQEPTPAQPPGAPKPG